MTLEEASFVLGFPPAEVRDVENIEHTVQLILDTGYDYRCSILVPKELYADYMRSVKASLKQVTQGRLNGVTIITKDGQLVYMAGRNVAIIKISGHSGVSGASYRGRQIQHLVTVVLEQGYESLFRINIPESDYEEQFNMIKTYIKNMTQGKLNGITIVTEEGCLVFVAGKHVSLVRII